VSYILIGLDAEHYKPDLNTDAVAMYLKSHQAPDGQWRYPAADTRPPICSDYIGQTALSLRALQLYAPKGDEGAYRRAIRLAASWLAKAQSTNNEDRSYAAGGWLMVREDTRHGIAAVLRCRFPPWLRSVDLGCREQLGNRRTITGLPGANCHEFARAIGLDFAPLRRLLPCAAVRLATVCSRLRVTECW
jgi:hypothetical protein